MQKWKRNKGNSRQEKKQVCMWTDAHSQSEANEQQPDTPKHVLYMLKANNWSKPP